MTTFYRNRKSNPKIHMEPQRTPNSQSDLENKNKASHFLISKYIIKLQQSKHYVTCIKTAIQTNGTEQRTQK